VSAGPPGAVAGTRYEVAGISMVNQ
jgi:hypothetical protein